VPFNDVGDDRSSKAINIGFTYRTTGRRRAPTRPGNQRHSQENTQRCSVLPAMFHPQGAESERIHLLRKRWNIDAIKEPLWATLPERQDIDKTDRKRKLGRRLKDGYLRVKRRKD
jgi:hypothetical protein